ncbi:hypothetical protein CLOM_g11295, partial [Closterium sp. NIES-68]
LRTHTVPSASNGGLFSAWGCAEERAASWRSTESARDGALLLDPYAGLLTAAEGSGREEEASGAGEAGDDAAEAASYLVATRFIDDAILEAVAQLVDGTEEIRQVVLLTDGYDTRPYRMAWPRPMVVFDVSPAAPYTACHQCLLEAGARPAGGSMVRHVSADLASGEDWRDEGWGEKLQRHGYRGDRPSLWVLQGLPHLSPSGLKAILGHLQGLLMAGCRVIGELPLQALAPHSPAVAADPSGALAALSSLFASHGLLAEVHPIPLVAARYAENFPTARRLTDNLGGSERAETRSAVLVSAAQQRMSDAQVELLAEEMRIAETWGDEEGFEDLP